MGLAEIFALAIALAMDAFAVAVCAGVSMQKFSLKKALIIGLYFGVFQALMPIIGYFTAAQFAGALGNIDRWAAFVLLSFIGGKMIFGATVSKKEDEPTKEFSVRATYILPLAVASSIDALAVGVSFAFIELNIVTAIAVIGVTTFALSVAGARIGSVFGSKFKSKAEIAGGAVLILIGLRILFL